LQQITFHTHTHTHKHTHTNTRNNKQNKLCSFYLTRNTWSVGNEGVQNGISDGVEAAWHICIAIVFVSPLAVLPIHSYNIYQQL
jgi:hypothetical protein